MDILKTLIGIEWPQSFILPSFDASMLLTLIKDYNKKII